MIVQFDTIHSHDCESGLQQEDSAPAALILTTKMLFQLDSAANDDCTSKPQHSTDNDASTSKPKQETKAFPSQGLDTYDGLRQEDSAPAALILTTKMLFPLNSNPHFKNNKNDCPI